MVLEGHSVNFWIMHFCLILIHCGRNGGGQHCQAPAPAELGSSQIFSLVIKPSGCYSRASSHHSCHYRASSHHGLQRLISSWNGRHSRALSWHGYHAGVLGLCYESVPCHSSCSHPRGLHLRILPDCTQTHYHCEVLFCFCGNYWALFPCFQSCSCLASVFDLAQFSAVFWSFAVVYMLWSQLVGYCCLHWWLNHPTFTCYEFQPIFSVQIEQINKSLN